MELSLRKLKLKQKGIVSRILAVGELGRRIRDLGIRNGVLIRVVGRAPLNDPVAIKVGDTKITLRNNEADHIFIEIENED